MPRRCSLDSAASRCAAGPGTSAETARTTRAGSASLSDSDIPLSITHAGCATETDAAQPFRFRAVAPPDAVVAPGSAKKKRVR